MPTPQLIAEAVAKNYAEFAGHVVIAELIPGQHTNANYVVSAKDGPSFLFRKYGAVPRAELDHELNLIKNLNQLHYPTPLARRNRENEFVSELEGTAYVMFDLIAGARPATLDELPKIVELVHRLHVMTWRLQGPLARERHPSLSALLTTGAASANLEASYISDLALRIRKATPESGLRQVCSHGALAPNDLLMASDGSGPFLVDFDTFQRAPITRDLAALIYNFAFDKAGVVPDVAIAHKIVNLYAAHSELNDKERSSLASTLLSFALERALTTEDAAASTKLRALDTVIASGALQFIKE